MRYGDDMILFMRTRHEAREIQGKAIKILTYKLKLPVNPSNDIVLCSDQPLHFLGHVITDKYAVVDKHTTRQILTKTTINNISSYKSLKLVKFYKHQINYIILDEISQILNT